MKVSEVMTRPLIRVLMTEKPITREAAEIVLRWKKVRKCTRHVSQAIKLYSALLAGDNVEFMDLLREYFPGRSLQFGAMQQPMTFVAQPNQSPVASYRPPVLSKPVISTQELLDNVPDEFGLEEMDFS